MPVSYSISAAEAVRMVSVIAGLFAALGIAAVLHHWLGLNEEYSRKFIHIGTGIAILFAPFLFPKAMPVLVIALLFLVFNSIAYAKGWLSAVHHTERASYGTVYFPAAFLVLTILQWERSPDIVVAGMLTLSLGDGAAAIVGESLRRPHRFTVTADQKSWEGSVTMIAASVIALVTVRLLFAGPLFVLEGLAASRVPLPFVFLAIAVFAAAWEAASSRGLDNLTVPLMTASALVFCVLSPEHADRFVVAVGLGFSAAALSHLLRFLTISGSFAAFLLAVPVFGVGGWPWAVPMLFFFVFSSLLSKAGRHAKHAFASMHEKSGARDAGQVAANGGLAGVLVMASPVFPSDLWYIAFLGAVAAVTADTWGTEIGAFSRTDPRFILTFKQVPKGTSGAISLLGSVAGAAGAAMITACALPFLPPGTRVIEVLAIVASAGIVGAAVDTILGATIQARFSCNICGAQTERREHCAGTTTLVAGFRWMDNDAVNATCALTGAATATALALFLR